METTGDRSSASIETRPDRANPDGEHLTGSDRLVGIALVGFMSAVVAAFWVPVLFHGLMTDELLSSWVSSDGLGDAIGRAQTYQGNSPLYFALLWAWRAVAGSSELVLRLPSVLCLLGAAWQLARMGAELDGGRRLTGLAAAFVLIADVDAMLAATTARPYALLLLSVVVSARALVHFLHRGCWHTGLLWVMAAAVSLLMSPFALLALVAHVVALVDAARGRAIIPAGSTTSRVDPLVWQRRLAPLVALGALATLPVVPQLVALTRRRDEIVTARLPDVADLIDVLVPVSLAGAVVLGIAVGGWRGRWVASDPVLRFVGAWAACPIVVSWAVSNLTGTSIWVDRYRIAAVPAFALLVGLGVGRVARNRGRAVACAALVVVSLWSVSGVAGLHRHGWREAVDWARVETAGEPVTIAIDNDLVELQNLDLLDDPAWQQYLSGPIEHYGLPGDVVLLPKGRADAAQAYQQRIIDELATGDDTVVLISRVLFRGPPHHLVDFRAAMTARGWVETAGPIVGPHQAVVFRR